MSPPPSPSTLLFSSLPQKKPAPPRCRFGKLLVKMGGGFFFVGPGRVYTCIEAKRGEVKVEDTSEIDR